MSHSILFIVTDNKQLRCAHSSNVFLNVSSILSHFKSKQKSQIGFRHNFAPSNAVTNYGESISLFKTCLDPKTDVA